MKRCSTADNPKQGKPLQPYIWLGVIYGVLTSLFIIFLLKSKKRGIKFSTTTSITYIPVETDLELDIATPDTSLVQDDLTRISGIGPVISNYLKTNGILTYQQLSKLSVLQINDLLAKKRYHLQDPQSWAHQAQLAANKDWEALAKFQKEKSG